MGGMRCWKEVELLGKGGRCHGGRCLWGWAGWASLTPKASTLGPTHCQKPGLHASGASSNSVLFQTRRISGCSADEFMQWQDRAAAAEREGFQESEDKVAEEPSCAALTSVAISSAESAPRDVLATAKGRADGRVGELGYCSWHNQKTDKEQGGIGIDCRVQSRVGDGEIKIPESLQKHMDRANARWKARIAAEGHRFASSR